jgi:hypothetical protein
MKENPPDVNDVFSVFASMPVGQQVLSGLFMATWLIGGNVLVAMHYRRMGKHWASGFKPFAFPFKDFNAKEWFTLFLLAIIAMSFGIAAVNYGR